MTQIEWVSVLMSIHDHKLNEPIVRDKSVMHILNEQPEGERAGRLNPDSD